MIHVRQLQNIPGKCALWKNYARISQHAPLNFISVSFKLFIFIFSKQWQEGGEDSFLLVCSKLLPLAVNWPLRSQKPRTHSELPCGWQDSSICVIICSFPGFPLVGNWFWSRIGAQTQAICDVDVLGSAMHDAHLHVFFSKRQSDWFSIYWFIPPNACSSLSLAKLKPGGRNSIWRLLRLAGIMCSSHHLVLPSIHIRMNWDVGVDFNTSNTECECPCRGFIHMAQVHTSLYKRAFSIC